MKQKLKRIEKKLKGWHSNLSGTPNPDLRGEISPYLRGEISPGLRGVISPNLWGKLSPNLWGEISPDLLGRISGIEGDVTNVTGNVEDCELTQEERDKGVNIKDLIEAVK